MKFDLQWRRFYEGFCFCFVLTLKLKTSDFVV